MAIPAKVELPTRKANHVNFAVLIPEIIYGHKITIQARSIDNPKQSIDACDGAKCHQTNAKAHIKFFSTRVDFSKIS